MTQATIPGPAEDVRPLTTQLDELACWLKDVPLSNWLLKASPENSVRAEELRWRFGPLMLDASKQRLDLTTLDRLLAWVEQCGLASQRQALFAGAEVNVSERRAALHTALRWPQSGSAPEGSAVAVEMAHRQRKKMQGLVERLRRGEWLGVSGKPIRHLVHIGVGGSDLGPRLVSEVLAESCNPGPVTVHYVSCMDGGELVPLMRELDPAATLLVVASKSFTTVDTLYNMRTALCWISGSTRVSEQAVVDRQVLGVSSRSEAMCEFGIPEAHQLEFEEWVGGRFSLWSTIGVSLAVQIGMPVFEELLAGAHALDRHFLEAPTRQNLPVLMALIGAWNSQFLKIPTQAVLPYDSRLALLPAYLQQLEMESNGKSCARDGHPVESDTCPILWGEVGPNAQHAFYQLLHQGSHTVSADLLAVAGLHGAGAGELAERLQDQQRLTLANCLAQSQLLALGDEAIPFTLQGLLAQGYRGNQPHSLLLLDELTPQSLGMLLALYEHKVFVQSLLWNLNPFDQPGVELGKRLANSLYRRLDGQPVEGAEVVDDVSTRQILARLVDLPPGAGRRYS